LGVERGIRRGSVRAGDSGRHLMGHSGAARADWSSPLRILVIHALGVMNGCSDLAGEDVWEWTAVGDGGVKP